MAEITPLLDDIDDSYPHNGEFEGEAHVPTTAYFKRLVKILIIITLILSTFTIALLIANYIIVCISLSRYRWDVRDSSVGLGIVMFVSLVFSIINVVVNFPILFNLIVDVVLTPFIILRVDRFINSLPASYYWCQNGPIYPQPGLPQDQPIPLNCEHWKTVVTVLMAIIASFGGIIAVIYLIQLLLRSISIIKSWKRSSWALPMGTISLEISLKFLKPESSTNKDVQSVADVGSRSVGGPVAGT